MCALSLLIKQFLIFFQGQDLVIGNVGDSRAVLGMRDKDDSLVPIQLTVDLKPNLPGFCFILSTYSMQNFVLLQGIYIVLKTLLIRLKVNGSCRIKSLHTIRLYLKFTLLFLSLIWFFEITSHAFQIFKKHRKHIFYAFKK